MLALPYPPSVNHYWRHVDGRTLVSKRGRAYRREVALLLLAARVRPLAGPVELTIVIRPPDRRRRDVDNVLKALLDALAHGGAFVDDSQVARLTIERGDPLAGGAALVLVEPR